MCIKSKVFAVLMAAAVSVTSFTPRMTAKAATWWEDICPKCGEYSILAEVVDYRNKTLETRPCVHGYEKEADLYLQLEQKMQYYCGDCDIHWEDWVTAPYTGPYWHCTHDN